MISDADYMDVDWDRLLGRVVEVEVMIVSILLKYCIKSLELYQI